MSITVVIVAGPNDGVLIEKNAALIKQNNPSVDVVLRVVDNSKYSGGLPVGEDALWELFDGIPMNAPGIDPSRKASSQHALALNRCIALKPIKTRYLLILDPDFFIYYKNWVSDVTTYMHAKSLAYFGAPWHPRWFTKYRGFPCVHCLFIDTHAVDLAKIDFTPGVPSIIASKVRVLPVAKNLRRSFFAPLLSYMYSMSLLRLDIGRAQDTGSQIFSCTCTVANTKVELLTPYVRPEDFDTVPHLRGRVGRILESLWPDSMSFIPKKPRYFTNSSLISGVLAEEIRTRGWEEFQWQGKLFGIHMRRYPAGVKEKVSNDELLTLLNQGNLD